MVPKRPNPLVHRLMTFPIQRPWTSLLMSLLLLGLLIPGLGTMGADFTYRIWFNSDDPQLQRFESFERRFGSDDNVVVVVHSPSGIFDEDSVSLLHNLTAELWQVPGIIRVDSLTNYAWTHAVGDEIVVEPLLGDPGELGLSEITKRGRVAVNHEVLPHYLLSPDGKTALIFGIIEPSFSGSPDYQLIVGSGSTTEPQQEGVRQKVAKFAGHTDHVFYLTGTAAISDAFRQASQEDLQTMLPILFGVIVFFLLASLRRVSGVVLPFVGIFFTIFMTLGLAGHVGIQFNIVLATLPNMLIAIAIADSVHILSSFLHLRRSGLDRRDAAQEALARNFRPTLLTSLSTAVGFLSFATADLVPLAHLGYLAAFGCMAAWALTLFFITPLLTLFPLRIKTTSPSSAAQLEAPHSWALGLTKLIGSYKKSIISFFLALATLSLGLGTSIDVNSNPFRYFADEFSLSKAQRFMENHVGGSLGPEIVISSGRADGIKDPDFLRRVDIFQKWLDKQPYITKTISIVDVLKQVNRSLHSDDPQWFRLPKTREEIAEQLFLYTMNLPQGMDLNDRVTLDSDAIRLTALWTLQTSKESVDAANRIEEKAAELGLNAQVTGKIMLYRAMNDPVVRAYLNSLAFALVGIAIILMVSLRSVRLGLLSLIPNTVPLALGAGMAALLHKPLDIGTVLVTSVCLGIAVDDTIHFLSGYHHWLREGHERESAIAMVFTHTGPALVVTTLVLVAGFGTFAFASYVPNVNFGILTALILSTALITDLFLLPALLLLRSQSGVDR